MINKKLGFTLIELVVVVTILAVLGTVGVLAISGYSLEARDSARLTDVNSMKKSLELHMIQNSKYPEPSSVNKNYFSGGLVWSQGTFGNSVLQKVKRLSNVPKDPLNDIEYTYSLANNGFEYQLGAIFEGNDLSYINKTNASSKIGKAYIAGNYNGTSILVDNGIKKIILAIPTIISSDITGGNLSEQIQNNKLVYYGKNNLPASYIDSGFDIDGGKDNINILDKDNYVVYEGNSIDDLLTDGENNGKKDLIQNLKNAYIGTDIENTSNIVKLMDLNGTKIEEKEDEYIKNVIISRSNNSVNISNNN